jgi:hypothetical protein
MSGPVLAVGLLRGWVGVDGREVDTTYQPVAHNSYQPPTQSNLQSKEKVAMRKSSTIVPGNHRHPLGTCGPPC